MGRIRLRTCVYFGRLWMWLKENPSILCQSRLWLPHQVRTLPE